jgi:hypothetical protein
LTWCVPRGRVCKVMGVTCACVCVVAQGGGCDPYFDVRLGDGKQLVFDWRKANKGKVSRGGGGG